MKVISSFEELESVYNDLMNDASENILLLNSKLPAVDRSDLIQLADEFSKDQTHGYVFISSSGSTRQLNESPKLYALEISKLKRSAIRAHKALNQESKDRWGLSLPWFHIGGLSIIYRSLMNNIKPVPLIEEKSNMEDFLNKVDSENVQFVSLVPAQIQSLIQLKREAPSCLKTILLGTGALTPQQEVSLKKLKYNWIESFGLTETLAFFAIKEGDFYKILPEVEINHHVHLTQDPQTLVIKSDLLATAYLQKKKGSIFKHDLKGEFESQDLVELIPEDRSKFKFIGRQDDVIKINGFNISLIQEQQDLKQYLTEKSFQLEPFVMTYNSQISSSLILAVTAVQDEKLLIELIKTYNQNQPISKRIGAITWLLNIDRTDLGKIKKEALAENLLRARRTDL